MTGLVSPLVGQGVPSPRSSTLLAVGAGSLWATMREGFVERIDAGRGQVAEPVRLGSARPWGVTVWRDSVWVTNPDAGSLSQIDAKTGRLQGKPILLGFPATFVADGEAPWLLDPNELSVRRLEW